LNEKYGVRHNANDGAKLESNNAKKLEEENDTKTHAKIAALTRRKTYYKTIYKSW